jgi:tetratricopeptide (TPR) repeat protein
MKNTLFLIGTIIFTSMTTSCGNNQPDAEKELVTEVDSPELITELDAIKALDDNLMKATQYEMQGIAKDLRAKAHDFANAYPTHSKTPAVLEVCAKACEILGKYDEAVNILHKLIYEFPETDETPKYMWNKARVIEEKMGKIPNAKAAYNELINRFPNHQMAIDAQFYIENFLGKSDEDILKFLDAQNALSSETQK